MTPFELLEPATLPEAVGLLDPDDPTVRPIAGGTALMLMMKAGVFRPTRLVSLRKLAPQYAGVAAGANGALAIGALTPLRSDRSRSDHPIASRRTRTRFPTTGPLEPSSRSAVAIASLLVAVLIGAVRYHVQLSRRRGHRLGRCPIPAPTYGDCDKRSGTSRC